MKELKTLKDFEQELDKKYFIEAKLLRAEAVKWVKYGDKHKAKDWRTAFLSIFNLTEDELNQKSMKGGKNGRQRSIKSD